MRFPESLVQRRSCVSRRSLLRFMAAAPVLAATGCAATSKQVCVTADGQRRCARTQARYVLDALEEMGIAVGEDDRIEPGDWVPLVDGLEITIVRVTTRTETQTQPVPFERRTIAGAGLAVGEQKLLQPGQEGEEELVYQITSEDGQEVERRLLSRRVVATPVDEIVATGSATEAAELAFSGTIAYLSQGNAWVMRGNAAAARALTAAGSLDGRVFDLSSDGKALLVTQRLEDEGRINALYTLVTDVVGSDAELVGVENVIAARWSPDGASVAYSRGEATQGSPGWRAFNDVQLLTIAGNAPPRELRPAQCSGLYCWWGPELAWSAGGSAVYMTDASSLRALPVSGGEERLIAEYPALRTESEWVWVPRPEPHPASDAALTMAWHQDAGDGSAVEDSQRFDAVLVDVATGGTIVLAEDVGMWTRPRYSRPGPGGVVRLAYAVAVDRRASATSAYQIWVAAADGSGAQRAYPPEAVESPTLTDFCWSPDGETLAIVADGGIYLYQAANASLQALALGVGAERVLWAE